MNRRAILASAGTIGVASLAGCLGATGLDEYTAEPAHVERSVLTDVGYERVEIDERVTEEEISYGPFDETVVVRNHLTEYERSIDTGLFGTRRTAGFLLLTSPRIAAFGREFNPVAEMDTGDLIRLVDDNYDGIDAVTHDSDETVTVLDQETTRSTFDADGEFGGLEIPVRVHVTAAVDLDDDFLATVAIHPRYAEQEGETAMTLANAANTGTGGSAVE